MAKLCQWLKVGWAALTSGNNQAFYDNISSIYDEVFVGHRVHAETIVDTLTKIYASKEKQTLVLDLGCGTGMLSRMLAEKKFWVIGLDFSFESLRVLRHRDAQSAAIQANAEYLPIASECLQSVVCLGVWRHITNMPRVLDEVVRILAPEGTLVVGYFPPAIAGIFHLRQGLGARFGSILYRMVTGALGYEDRADFSLEVETEAAALERFERVDKVTSGSHWYLLLARSPKKSPNQALH